MAGCEKHHALRNLTSRRPTHAYACKTPKKLRLVCQPDEVWKGSKEARPSPIRQARPHALLGALPSRACLPELGRPGLGEADELLAPVLPGANGHPAGVDQWTEVTCQRRLVQRRQAAEVSLPDLTRAAKVTSREYWVVRRPTPRSSSS